MPLRALFSTPYPKGPEQLVGVTWACATVTDHTGGKIHLLLFLMRNSPKALAFKCILQIAKHQLVQPSPSWGGENKTSPSPTCPVLHHQISY